MVEIIDIIEDYGLGSGCTGIVIVKMDDGRKKVVRINKKNIDELVGLYGENCE